MERRRFHYRNRDGELEEAPHTHTDHRSRHSAHAEPEYVDYEEEALSGGHDSTNASTTKGAQDASAIGSLSSSAPAAAEDCMQLDVTRLQPLLAALAAYVIMGWCALLVALAFFAGAIVHEYRPALVSYVISSIKDASVHVCEIASHVQAMPMRRAREYSGGT